jgi:periplasmic divalent cation tolerance protein
MAMPDSTVDALVVLVTVPDAVVAERLAETLVGEGLAACVNIVPQIRSIYRWKGAVEHADELLCLVKTTRDGFERVRARVVALHPYEVPEVMALPVESGHAAYLLWLAGSVTAPRE